MGSINEAPWCVAIGSCLVVANHGSFDRGGTLPFQFEVPAKFHILSIRNQENIISTGEVNLIILLSKLEYICTPSTQTMDAKAKGVPMI